MVPRIPTVPARRLALYRLAALRHSLLAVSIALVSAAYLLAAGASEPTLVAWISALA
jgi:hypothetical protein